MTTIAIDGLNEEEFRRSVESRMRHGLASKAVEQLRVLIAPFAAPGGILPERFLTVSASDLSLGGWDALGDSLRRHDRPGRPVTALSITFGWPGEDMPQPDAEGRLSPLIETGYYTDDAFPFSQSSREDLLEGYSFHGCTWTGDCEATDTALWLTGIDDLHGALAGLEARLLASDEPDEDGIRAGSLGACLLSVLLFQAVDERIVESGLPRALCVMAGSNGVYPYFDAPVAGFPEEARKAAEAAEDEVVVDAGIPAPRYSSLLVTGIPRARKRAVLVLAETADEEASRIARLRGIAHAEAHAAAALPEPPLRSDGTIASAPASPLLVKKPAGQSWDFREMLSPYEPEADAAAAAAEPLELDDDWDKIVPLEPEQDRGGGGPSEPEPDWGAAQPVEPENDLTGDDAFEPEQDWGEDQPTEPEPDPGEIEPLELEQDWATAASFEPAEEPVPISSGNGAAAPVGPGFSLLDALREERQQPIFPLPDFHIVDEDEEKTVLPVEPEPEPEPFLPSLAELGPDPEPVAFAVTKPAAEPEPVVAAVVESAPSAWPLDPAWLRDVEARILPKSPGGEPVVRKPAWDKRPASKGLWARLSDWWYGRR